MAAKASCTNCLSDQTHVTDSRILEDGGHRRRYRCAACGCRWTVWTGEPPQKGRSAKAKNPKFRAPLTEEEVRQILTSPLKSLDVSVLIGCSRQTVASIRSGKSHSDICPELTRINKPQSDKSCSRCVLWNGLCSIGIPEAQIKGMGFADDCSAYQEKTRGKNHGPQFHH